MQKIVPVEDTDHRPQEQEEHEILRERYRSYLYLLLFTRNPEPFASFLFMKYQCAWSDVYEYVRPWSEWKMNKKRRNKNVNLRPVRCGLFGTQIGLPCTDCKWVIPILLVDSKQYQLTSKQTNYPLPRPMDSQEWPWQTMIVCSCSLCAFSFQHVLVCGVYLNCRAHWNRAGTAHCKRTRDQACWAPRSWYSSLSSPRS